MQHEVVAQKRGLAAYCRNFARHVTLYKERWLVLTGILLLTVISQISIPLQPVPITMQTVAVILIGLTYQRTTALAAVCGYLLLGLIGAPVFANFYSGYATFIGPTGGYLLGFPLAVWAMTSLRNTLNYRLFLPSLLGGLLGTAVIFSVGILWLSTFVGWEKALLGGFYPFILPGLFKALFLAATLRLTLNLPWLKLHRK